MSDLDSAEAIERRGRDYAHAISLSPNCSDAAALYADALRTYGPNGVAWNQVNGAILARWSESVLNWIKRQAWKQAKDGGA